MGLITLVIFSNSVYLEFDFRSGTFETKSFSFLTGQMTQWKGPVYKCRLENSSISQSLDWHARLWKDLVKTSR